MKCPECGYDMRVMGTKTTHDSTGKKTYDWKKLWCKNDDVWIELEIPKETD